MKPPEYLGPYQIGETLGKGGMGSVFKAQHVKSREVVAVKLISAQMSDEMRFRRRFDTEVKTLKLLSHPNIVKLIGFGEEQGMLFYSMEYVQGETLQQMIRRQKKLTWMKSLDIAIQICAALKHAHDFGVIHRDLKPANLVVQTDGTVKLLDFGISKIFGQDQTAAGSIMGTADYMAPEQANDGGITARTDLFSLGCVLYAMLSGKPPFRGKNLTAVITALQYKDPVPLDLVDPELPDDIVQIVGELLQKRPENRPPTALAVMNRLKAMRAGLNRRNTLVDSGANESDSRATDKSPFDTTGPQDARAALTHVPEDKTRSADTMPTRLMDGNDKTVSHGVDPSARTIRTEGRSSDRGTVLGTSPATAVTAAMGTANEGAQDDLHSDGDTAVGTTGKTHFQTVSDGEVREGFFAVPKAKQDHPALRAISITTLSVLLIIGVASIVHFSRGPSAEELLMQIESPDQETQSYKIENEIERFLKLFPDHPKAHDVRQRQMVNRVDTAVRRLKRNTKLHVDERPLYEKTFLEAMELRASDPVAAREKLVQWIDVFSVESLSQQDEQANLAELAAFEAERLQAIQTERDGQPNDPKLAELLERIEDAKRLPLEERTRLLEGILSLYEGQPWAEPARQIAQALLQADSNGR